MCKDTSMTRIKPSCAAVSLMFCLHHKIFFYNICHIIPFPPQFMIGFCKTVEDENPMNKWRCYLRRSFYYGAWGLGSWAWIEQEMTAFLRKLWIGMWETFLAVRSWTMFKAIEKRISFCTRAPKYRELNVLHDIIPSRIWVWKDIQDTKFLESH